MQQSQSKSLGRGCGTLLNKVQSVHLEWAQAGHVSTYVVIPASPHMQHFHKLFPMFPVARDGGSAISSCEGVDIRSEYGSNEEWEKFTEVRCSS
jgi:hypothetical protein